jgi:hypothetical protein
MSALRQKQPFRSPRALIRKRTFVQFAALRLLSRQFVEASSSLEAPVYATATRREQR